MPRHPKHIGEIADTLRDLPVEPRLGKGSPISSQRELWSRSAGSRKQHQYHFFCPEDVAKQIRQFCADNNISYAMFFSLAAEEYLDKHK